jgi:hypothetical protein
MGFFEIFKKKKEVPEIERISLEDVDKKMKSLLLEFKKNEEIIKKDISEKMKIFSNELNEQIKILHQVGLEKRKEDIRLKERVLDSKNAYIEHCEKLNEEILNLEYNNPEEFFRDLNHILIKFEKNSHKSFEMATILIGEEIANIRGLVRNFFRSQERLYLENKEMFVKKNIATEILEKYVSLNNLKKLKTEASLELENLRNSLKDNFSLAKKQEQNILEFRKTKEFQNMLRYNEERKTLKYDLIKKAEVIRDKIGLKNLLGVYHKNEKLRELIRKYKSNFIEAMIEDKENNLSKIISRELNEEILRIKKDLNELDKKEDSETKKEEKDLEKQLTGINEEISGIEKQKKECENKLDKFKIKEFEKIKEIKKDLIKLGLEGY